MYYSQHGEDVILNHFFKDKKGFFIEVGALDGIHYSNTYFLEKKGWNGICIEPHPLYFELLKRNRKSICLNVAISNENEENADFYSNSRGSLSTLSKKSIDKYKKKYPEFTTKIEEIKIEVRTLDYVLSTNNINQVDLISIDTEGNELNVLLGFNILKFSPSIIIIEDPDENTEVEKYLINKNYFYSRKLFANKIFCLRKEDSKTIKNIGRGKYTRTTIHPIEKGEIGV